MIITHIAGIALAAVVATIDGAAPATGTLRGNVRDSQGAAVVGARL